MNEWFFANGTWRRDNIARHSSSLVRTANAFPVFFILHPEFACDHRYSHASYASASYICMYARRRRRRNFIFKIQTQKILTSWLGTIITDDRQAKDERCEEDGRLIEIRLSGWKIWKCGFSELNFEKILGISDSSPIFFLSFFFS